jgi:hypothetical protein
MSWRVDVSADTVTAGGGIMGRRILGFFALAVVPLLALAADPPGRSPRERDERGMRIYYMGFLTGGPAWTPEQTDATRALQEAHLANIGRLALRIIPWYGPYGLTYADRAVPEAAP